MTGTIMEVGPSTIRFHPNRQSVSPEMVAAALAGIDDTTVLLDERPVSVADLWRRLITAGMDRNSKSLTVVHPSGWPRRRVDRIVKAATQVVSDVAATTELPPKPAPAKRRPVIRSRRGRGLVIVTASVVLTLCSIGVATNRNHTPATALGDIDIIEGRVTLQIPLHWAVTRITAGPGSRRIQASSPTDPNVALHVTQSYSPGETLDRTAEILRHAVDEQPSGVFVDFNPVDRRGQRPAVTYREVRVGRDIRWTVVLDGSTRISVGCQSAPGREDAVAEPCAKAIESAREFGGTKSGP